MRPTKKLILATFAAGLFAAGAALAETDNPAGEGGAPGIEDGVVDGGIVDGGVVDDGTVLIDDGIVGDGGESGEVFTFGGGDGSELMFASGASEDFGDSVAGDDFAGVTESLDVAEAIGDDIDKATDDRSDKKLP